MSSVTVLVTVLAALLGGTGLGTLVSAMSSRRTTKADATRTYTDTALTLIAAVKDDAADARAEATEARRECAEVRREASETRRALMAINNEAARIERQLNDCADRLANLVGMIRNPLTTMEDLRQEIVDEA